MVNGVSGYAGKILRVDLTQGSMTPEIFDEVMLRKYIGGASLGARLLYDEVPPGVEWSDARNHIFLFSGPLGGTRVSGSGAINVVSKGALTNGTASTQANGVLGAYLRFSGLDGIILQGASPDWVYLYIHDGTAELRDASHLTGRDTFETSRIIKEELGRGEKEASVLSIGPAGEHLVRFACVCVDMGHVAAHNGPGAVMGSKKLKAIAVDRGKGTVPIKDRRGLSQIARQIVEKVTEEPHYKPMTEWGTLPSYMAHFKGGDLPVKNYTTSIPVMGEDKLFKYSPPNIRQEFTVKPAPCWACNAKHWNTLEIPEGKYSGRTMKEPEYEQLSGWSTQVGITDVAATIALSGEVDRLGMDTNEASWLTGWVLECYEKGILAREDTDGLEMTWGNDDAIMAMLNKIAMRQGFGNLLAEGVMRAAQQVGGEATKLAIHTRKGNTPRNHDHRVNMWLEMFDTCVSNTGTLESIGIVPWEQFGIQEEKLNMFNLEEVSTMEAKIKGAMIFEDSMSGGKCRYGMGARL